MKAAENRPGPSTAKCRYALPVARNRARAAAAGSADGRICAISASMVLATRVMHRVMRGMLASTTQAIAEWPGKPTSASRAVSRVAAAKLVRDGVRVLRGEDVGFDGE